MRCHARAAVWVNQLAILIQRHRIDGQVATVQIVFQRHIGRGVKGKPV